MSEPTGRLSVAALAHRLRLLQAEMRDVPAGARAGLLREQIEAALKGLPPDKERAFLRELADHFPAGASPAGAPATPAPAAAPSPVPAATPAELFLAMGPEQQAAAVSELLSQGVLELPAAPESGRELTGDTDARAMLCGFMSKVIPFFLRALSSLGIQTEGVVDRASVQRLEALAAGECATMDVAELRAEMDQLGLCLCALVSAIPTLGKFCAQALSEELSAERVEDLARNEGKGTFERWEAVYWRKYREVSAAFADGTLERDVNQRVAAHVDKWLQRTRQQAPARKGKAP